MKNLVTNLELSKRLYEAGITEGYEGLFWWCEMLSDWEVAMKGTYDWHDHPGYDSFAKYPALTLQELLEAMPECIDLKYGPYRGTRGFLTIGKDRTEEGYVAHYTSRGCSDVGTFDKGPLQSLSKLAEYLLDNQLWNA